MRQPQKVELCARIFMFRWPNHRILHKRRGATVAPFSSRRCHHLWGEAQSEAPFLMWKYGHSRTLGPRGPLHIYTPERAFGARLKASRVHVLTARKTLFTHTQVLHAPSYASYRSRAVASARHSASTRSDEGLESKRGTDITIFIQL